MGFLPCNYAPVTWESSSKQLGHADILEPVKKANYLVNLSGKHNYKEVRLTVPQVLIFIIGVDILNIMI